MKSSIRKLLSCSITTLMLSIISFTAHSKGDDMPIASPEKMGMSSERLEKVVALAKRYVEQQSYSGVVTLIARKGKIVHLNAEGNMGIDNTAPLKTDSLFRIYSMTKPVTAVAAMILYEDGRFNMTDPVSKFLPEFAEQKLLVVKDNGETELVAPKTPITMRHLLTHTAGLSYGWTPDNPVDVQYGEAKLFENKSLPEFTQALAKIPLRFEPGTRYHYSVAFDVVGAVIEKLSGMPLDKFYQENIFGPLDMNDTFFEVPADKIDRLASDQGWDYKNNKIAVVPAEQSRNFLDVSLMVGGGGLVSTAEDYLRFSQMVMNGGSLNGVRILGPKTVQFISANHLTRKVWEEGRGQYPALDFYAGQSMALGYGVVTEPGIMPDISSKGELSWGGVAGTQFWIDPEEQLIGIALVQLYQSPWPLRFDFKSATYQALTELN